MTTRYEQALARAVEEWDAAVDVHEAADAAYDRARDPVKGRAEVLLARALRDRDAACERVAFAALDYVRSREDLRPALAASIEAVRK